MGPGDDLVSGGPLLVDDEGSLWMGTFAGLLQFPEPATRLFSEADGLPSDHVRSLAAEGDALWVSTWQGSGRIRWHGEEWRTETVAEAYTQGRLCTAPDGAVWAAARDRLLEIRAGRVEPHPAPGAGGLGACAGGESGRLWLPAGGGLFVHRPALAPRPVVLPGEEPPAPVTAALELRDGRLLVAAGERVCAAPAGAVAAGQPVAWACDALAGAVVIGDLAELPSGDVWAVSERTGVHRWRRGRWEPLGAPRDRVGILALEPSRDGSVWVLGHGRLHRVEERPAGTGWQVVEELSGWHGVGAGRVADLHEAADGSLWLATIRGVFRVPAAARTAPMPPPRVRIVGAAAAGRPLPLDAAPRVPFARRQIQLEFGALTFRDRGPLRYRLRTRAGAPWEELRGLPSFHFLELSPGAYRAEVQASLDGQSWSTRPAVYSFHIEPPWYRTWWATGAALVLLAGAVAAAYRSRVRHLVELERQRTRIAMDLHDEMGSGLGSIGILASVLARSELAPDERVELAAEARETAGELGVALSEIVWSLRPGPEDLRQLAVHLAEHGSRLFADESLRFATDFPQRWPRRQLSTAVRRNVVLVALEALHNARRHSAGSRVTLGLAPSGRRWRLWVEDDGRGLPPAAPGAAVGGVGFASMERRAGEIGARLRVAPAGPRGGVRVELLFAPRARARAPVLRRPRRTIVRRHPPRAADKVADE